MPSRQELNITTNLWNLAESTAGHQKRKLPVTNKSTWSVNSIESYIGWTWVSVSRATAHRTMTRLSSGARSNKTRLRTRAVCPEGAQVDSARHAWRNIRKQ